MVPALGAWRWCPRARCLAPCRRSIRIRGRRQQGPSPSLPASVPVLSQCSTVHLRCFLLLWHSAGSSLRPQKPRFSSEFHSMFDHPPFGTPTASPVLREPVGPTGNWTKGKRASGIRVDPGKQGRSGVPERSAGSPVGMGCERLPGGRRKKDKTRIRGRRVKGSPPGP